ncbi:hypothetical protein SANTM175S_02761 [Streptomyces antimycoticus]
MNDVQAVRLGHQGLAYELAHATRTRGRTTLRLSQGGTLLYERLLDTACLHILHFFTQRSAFVPRTLVEQRPAQRADHQDRHPDRADSVPDRAGRGL